MKRNNILLLIVAILTLTIGIKNVNAETDTTISYNISVVKNKDTGSAEGVISGVDNSSSTKYYVYVAKDTFDSPKLDDTKPNCGLEITTDVAGAKIVSDIKVTEDQKFEGKFDLSPEWNLLAKDYETAYVVREVTSETDTVCTVTANPYALKRISIPDIDKRYNLKLFDGTYSEAKLRVFAEGYYLPANKFENAMNLKIGKVTDKNILTSLAKKEADAYKKLMEYADNDSDGKIFQGTIAKEIEYKGVQIEDGAYYYVYINMNNPEDKYINLDGISIVTGKSGFLSSEFEYKIETTTTTEEEMVETETTQPETKEPTVEEKAETTVEEKVEEPKNPVTGVFENYMYGIVIAFVAGSSYLLVRKTRKLHR